MQVGEILLGARRTVERFHVGGELDEIAGDESSREPHVTQQLHQQPRGVAAGSGLFPERELGRLHTRLHANEVLDVVGELGVELDKKIDGAFALPGESCAGIP
jgi:hypothetical protein